jgi:hypothetical protein
MLQNRLGKRTIYPAGWERFQPVGVVVEAEGREARLQPGLKTFLQAGDEGRHGLAPEGAVRFAVMRKRVSSRLSLEQQRLWALAWAPDQDLRSKCQAYARNERINFRNSVQLPSVPRKGDISALVLRQIILSSSSVNFPLSKSSMNDLMMFWCSSLVCEIASSIKPSPFGNSRSKSW